MKKYMLLFAALMLICCFGCSNRNNDQTENDVPTDSAENSEIEGKDNISNTVHPNESDNLIYDGAELLGVDISGLTAEKAYERINDRIQEYSLNLEVNKKSFAFSSGELALTCNKQILQGVIEKLASGEKTVDDEICMIVSFDTTAVNNALHSTFDTAAKNSCLSYSGEGKKFVLMPEESGTVIESGDVIKKVTDAVLALKTELKADAPVKNVTPEIAQSGAKAKAALEKANNMLSVSLEYIFTPDEGGSTTEILSRGTIGSLLYIKNDGLSVDISSSALNSYVSKMDAVHSVPDEKGKFLTTGGSYLNIEVTYGGQSIDKKGLYNDISYCILNSISGVRTAPYLDIDPMSKVSFGGNYVEIDLNSQYMWVYKNGVCVVSSPIVSGCVKDKNMTPTGVYSIQNKATNTYLAGPTWRDWVYFWMPFYGNYGMHDADGWRNEYGGNIYLYDGSHGCVNMPYGAARDTYNNVSVGTRVVLYGGAQSVELVEQGISGTTEYTVDLSSEQFYLDAVPKYPGGKLKYSTSDSGIAEVDSEGKVTVNGYGTCTITVEMPAWGAYSYASMEIEVSVVSPCSLGKHDNGEWEILKMPTCTDDGERVKKCKLCVEIIEREIIPATGHDFSDEDQYCTNGCGTENPEYVQQ